MRNFIDILKLMEDGRPTKVKDQTLNLDLSLDMPTSKGEVSTSRASTSMAALPGRQATAADTMRSMPRGDADVMSAWSRIARSGTDTEVSNADAAGGMMTAMGDVAEPRIENLPAVINTAVSTSGMHIEPKWHQIKHLPGYLADGIRAMGRAVFAPVTDTPIEDIQVLSTLSNDDVEVKAMATWLKRNGVRDDAMEMKFHEILPGYGADVQVWSAEGFKFIVVRDPMGHYIYGVGEGRGTRVSGSAEAPRLR
jgi:hypothetical protein